MDDWNDFLLYGSMSQSPFYGDYSLFPVDEDGSLDERPCANAIPIASSQFEPDPADVIPDHTVYESSINTSLHNADSSGFEYLPKRSAADRWRQENSSIEASLTGDTLSTFSDLGPSVGQFTSQTNLWHGSQISYTHRYPETLTHPTSWHSPGSHAEVFAEERSPKYGQSTDSMQGHLQDLDPSEILSFSPSSTKDESDDTSHAPGEAEPTFSTCAVKWLKTQERDFKHTLLAAWKSAIPYEKERGYKWSGNVSVKDGSQSEVGYKLGLCKSCDHLVISIPKNAQRIGTELAGARGKQCLQCNCQHRKNQAKKAKKQRQS